MSNEQVITMAIILFEFLEKYVFVPGVIENLILVIDTLDISVFNAPHGMLKAMMTTI
jgi:hypothetical protein